MRIGASPYVRVKQDVGGKLIGSANGTRYSKDFKFRPAASPVITEKLQDGRTRVRGAAPTMRL